MAELKPVHADVEVTSQLCDWIHSLKLEDVPAEVQTRAKHLMLDGLACALYGAHIPWSEDAAKAILEFEPPGKHTVVGWDQKLGPLAAALLNSAFIQACELDDFHSVAPLHAASILLPALLAAAEYESQRGIRTVNGSSLLLAFIVGLEVGPRAGLALNGADVLSMGWHCGPIFGHPAAAAAVSKLFSLSPASIEDAIGMACTQSCGLMAAQYEGMIKRFQHGFAARNGLFGALLARSGYTGIKKIFERPYGGYLSMFTQGSAKEPRYQELEVVKDLGAYWHTNVYRTKLYACVGGAHGLIEVIDALQVKHADRLAKPTTIKSMAIRLSKPVFAHCGWTVTERPLTATAGQMNCAYIAAIKLVERQVLLAQFSARALDSADVWLLLPRIECMHGPEFDDPKRGCGAYVKIVLEDGAILEETVDQPRGFDPPLPNEKIKEKWESLTQVVIDKERSKKIEEMVIELERVEDIGELALLLGGEVASPMF